MATDPQLEKQIEELEAVVNAAVTGTSVDGLSVQFDLAQAQKRLAELRRRQDPSSLSRPRVVALKIRNAW